MIRVTALVVTYNRKNLLTECLNAILSQTFSVTRILVINNHSTDGTEELFRNGNCFDLENVILETTEKNLGGAGGFSYGIKKSMESDNDYIWIMDDDTIPDPDALKELIAAMDYLKSQDVIPGYLASTVFGIDGEVMNVPVISRKKAENGYMDWYRYLDQGLVCLRHATFVSLLLPREAIEKVGFPVSDYFIWGDDTEYTQRLGKYYGEGYFVGKSRVIHKRFNAKSVNILTEENRNRVSMYHYYYRNSLITAREYNPRGNSALHVCEFILVSLKCLIKKNVSHRWLKFVTVQKGIWEYLFTSHRYREQIHENIR